MKVGAVINTFEKRYALDEKGYERSYWSFSVIEPKSSNNSLLGFASAVF